MYIVIPAYCPDEKLFGVIDGLKGENNRFIVVDDGSGESYAPIFRRLEKDYPDIVQVIHHSLNRGKGHAMKTAFEYIERIASEDDGIITVDADGQHLANDARKIISAWESSPDSLVIGGRHFTGKVPFKSKWGNGFTRIVFAITTGVRVYDTQTGLRAFSVKRIHEMLTVKGERYDFEIAQLLYCVKQHIDILEVPIETVYIEGNRSSHFRVFRDSWLINKMIFGFILSSFSSFIVDYGLLLVLAQVFNSLKSTETVAPAEFRMLLFGTRVDTHLVALIIARTVSSTLNFILNRNIVFKQGSKAAILRFYLVIFLMMAANYGLLTLVANNNGLPLSLAQLVVQASLYPFSFLLQRKFVFREKNKAVNKLGK